MLVQGWHRYVKGPRTREHGQLEIHVICMEELKMCEIDEIPWRILRNYYTSKASS